MAQRDFEVLPYRRNSPRISGPHAAAEQSGTMIVDRLRNRLYDFSRRDAVRHAEIVLPGKFESEVWVDWARERADLWNVVEAVAVAERDPVFARKYEADLPPELDEAQHVELTRTFARTLADRHKTAVDFAVHGPYMETKEPFKAHFLVPTRELTAHGMGDIVHLFKGQYRDLRLAWDEQVRDAILTAQIKEALAGAPDIARQNWAAHRERQKTLAQAARHNDKATTADVSDDYDR